MRKQFVVCREFESFAAFVVVFIVARSDQNWCVLFQFLGRSGPTWSQGLPTDRAGHSPNASEDNRHRGSSLLIQEPQFQVS